MPKTRLALLASLATLASFGASCGGSQKSMSAGGAAPSDAGDPGVMGMDQRATRDEISELHVTITNQAAQLGIDPLDAAYDQAAPALPMSSAVDSCGVAPAGETCSDVCTLADSICANATRICELADTMPGDAWAAERCDDGKVSCSLAHVRCCGCQ